MSCSLCDGPVGAAPFGQPGIPTAQRGASAPRKADSPVHMPVVGCRQSLVYRFVKISVMTERNDHHHAEEALVSDVHKARGPGLSLASGSGRGIGLVKAYAASRPVCAGASGEPRTHDTAQSEKGVRPKDLSVPSYFTSVSLRAKRKREDSEGRGDGVCVP